MKKINGLIIKKRFPLLLLLGLCVLFMNLFIWNETTQLVRELPILTALKEKSSHRIYESNYIPPVTTNGQMQSYSLEERSAIQTFLSTNFLEADKIKVYLNKHQYLTHQTADKALLVPLTKVALEKALGNETLDTRFLNDLLVVDTTEQVMEGLEEEARNLGFPLTFNSLNDTFQSAFDYYFKNFLFGLTAALVLLTFSLFLVYWIISSSLKISKAEIRLLRIIGLPKQKILNNFKLLLVTPIIFMALFFLIIVKFANFQLIFADYLYLLLINSSLVFFALFITGKKTKELLFND